LLLLRGSLEKMHIGLHFGSRLYFFSRDKRFRYLNYPCIALNEKSQNLYNGIMAIDFYRNNSSLTILASFLMPQGISELSTTSVISIDLQKSSAPPGVVSKLTCALTHKSSFPDTADLDCAAKLRFQKRVATGFAAIWLVIKLATTESH